MAANQTHLADIDRIRQLEQEMARARAWDSEKRRYALNSIGGGSVAYMLKPDARGAEPAHWLCANCYENGHKSYLQRNPMQEFGNVFDCAKCDARIIAGTNKPVWL